MSTQLTITLAERLRLFWWNWVRRPLINTMWRLRELTGKDSEEGSGDG